MTKNEISKGRLPLYVRGLAAGKYTLRQAAASTGYSTRRLSYLKNEFIKKGEYIFDKRAVPRVPPNKIPETKKLDIIRIYSEKYHDINFKFFRDCLEEFEGINISLPSLRVIMADAGIISPNSHRVKVAKSVHRPRLRRDCEGDLIQVDGTPFAWFYKFGENKRYCMTGAIDDASGKITGLYITEFECLYGYCEVMRQTINRFGIPREIYSDRAAIFCVTPKNKQNLTPVEALDGIHEKRTQWQRILTELGINQILAWSPEAKGRVERMWQTLQGRLPQLFYLAGVDTVEKANAWLPGFIDRFNAEFSVPARCDDSFFIRADDCNLDDILCAKFPRLTNSAGVLSFHSYKFSVLAPRCACQRVVVCISERGLFAKIGQEFYPMRLLGDDDITEVVGDHLPQVVKNIIYKYMFAFAKEVSA